MRSLPWIVFTFAVVLGGVWMTKRRGAATLVSPDLVIPETPAEDRSVSAEPERAPRLAEVPTIQPVVLEGLPALVVEFGQVVGTDAGAELDVLYRAVDLGLESRNEQAFEFVVRAVTHPGSVLQEENKKQPRMALLRRAAMSAAVGRYARETIETVVADTDGFERKAIQDFQVLLAAGGRRPGIRTLLEHLATRDGELSKGAAEALKFAVVDDADLFAELSDWVFAELLSPDPIPDRFELAQALLAFDNDGARPRLWAIAFEGAEVELLPDVAHEIRGVVLRALADGFDAETRDRSIAFYRDRTRQPDPDAALRDQVPAMWNRLAWPNGKATPEEVEARVALLEPLEQLFLEALSSGEGWRVEDARLALGAHVFKPLDPMLEAALDAAVQRD